MFLMRAHLVHFAQGSRDSTASAAAVLIAEVRFAQVLKGNTVSAVAVMLVKVCRKYTMVLIGKSAAAAGTNTAVSHSEHLEKLRGTNMRSGVVVHKAICMHSEAQPPVAAIVSMGSVGATVGTASGACSRSEVAQCLRHTEAHTDWKSEVDMVLMCSGSVEPHV
jgi:hypothetical protein